MSADDHDISGDAKERLRAVLARRLCGWTGHDDELCPNHFLADADRIIADIHSAGLTVVNLADLVNEGKMTINGARALMGLPTYEFLQASEPFVMTPTGPAFLNPDVRPVGM